MKRFISILIISIFTLTSFAQESGISKLEIEFRSDFSHNFGYSSSTGFDGKYLNFSLDGNITPNISYSLKQRLNKSISQSNLFSATDWATITYTTKKWQLSAGKQVVAIGGYEYDAAPIDLYFASEFWNNIPCYQFGVSASYIIGDNDYVMFQLCESPFSNDNDARFGYNLLWKGDYDWYQTFSSLNLFQTAPNCYIGYIAIGNLFKFGKFTISIDIMERIQNGSIDGENMSFMGDIKYKVNDKLTLLVNGSHDFNNSEKDNDYCVLKGINISRLSGGLEWFPLKNNNVRVHALFNHNFGDKEGVIGVLTPKTSTINLGITWKANLLNIKK